MGSSGINTNSMDPYNQYNQPGPYGGQPGFDPNCQEGDRGLGKKLAIGAGVAALAVGTAVVAGGIYHHHKKQKKKKTVYVNGKSRDIDCDVLVDDRGIELPGQQFDERGVCVNEQEVLSRAANSGQIQGGGQQQQWGGPPQQQWGAPPQQQWGAPPPQQQWGGAPPQQQWGGGPPQQQGGWNQGPAP